MSPAIRKYLPLALKIAVAGIAVYVFVVKFDREQALRALTAARPVWAVLAIAVSAIAFTGTAARLAVILRTINRGAGATVGYLYGVNLAAAFYNLFLPTSVAGETVRTLKVAPFLNGSYAKAAAAVLLDRALGAVTWALILAAACLPRLSPALIAAGTGAAAAAFLLRKQIGRAAGSLSVLKEFRVPVIGAALSISLAGQLVMVGANIAIFRCFGINLDPITSIAIIAAANIAAGVPLSLFGFTLREGSYLGLLPLYGVPLQTAVLAVSFMVVSGYLFGAAGGIWELATTGEIRGNSGTSALKNNNGEELNGKVSG